MIMSCIKHVQEDAHYCTSSCHNALIKNKETAPSGDLSGNRRDKETFYYSLVLVIISTACVCLFTEGCLTQPMKQCLTVLLLIQQICISLQTLNSTHMHVSNQNLQSR